MRILILSHWFTPEPTFKGLRFARELQKLGHEVEVLTGFPNYPGGKIYPGYKIKLYQREMMDGVPVIRVALYPSHDASALRRIANYVSFAISATLLGPFLVRKPDVIYVYHPPATVALPAVVLGWLRRAPFVYDVNDLWPDTLAATGMLNNRMLLRLIGTWSRWTYRAARRVTVISKGFARKLEERGVPAAKISMIYNWAEECIVEGAAKAERREPGFEGHFNIVFAGTMGKAQALDAVIDAAALVGRRHQQVRFVFIGAGVEVERLKARTLNAGLSNVVFLPRRPVEEIATVLASADVLLVHLKDDPLFAITIPSKTQAYLAAGRPIIMAVRGDAADLVKEADAGVTCEPENAESIAAAVEQLWNATPERRRQMGENGRAFYRSRLSMEKAAESFARVLSESATR